MFLKVYINDLATSLSNPAVIAPFADDISIITTAPYKKDATVVALSKTNIVCNWSPKWKLNFNVNQSEV